MSLFRRIPNDFNTGCGMNLPLPEGEQHARAGRRGGLCGREHPSAVLYATIGTPAPASTVTFSATTQCQPRGSSDHVELMIVRILSSLRFCLPSTCSFGVVSLSRYAGHQGVCNPFAFVYVYTARRR